MRTRKLIVLKFGGSVLTDVDSLRGAVHEIYRWRRKGWRVVAVVSAFKGRTDQLFQESLQRPVVPDSATLAAVLACEEHFSATQLALQLDSSGVPACVLTPAALEFIAEGDALDATPLRLNPHKIEQALEREEVVVVPGYGAVDEGGRAVVLGRGGSDLSALFLASCLNADCCRLVKDVPALYDRDPAVVDEEGIPQRFGVATWGDALSLDGSVIQHKALRFARSLGLDFELGDLNSVHPTRIGRGPTLCLPTDPLLSKPMRIVLLGLGTVGACVWKALRAKRDLFEVTAVCVRRQALKREGDIPKQLIAADLQTALQAPADVVIELMGGIEQATAAIEQALALGIDVITANKAVIAKHGDRLHAMARKHGARLSYSAAVGGSMPLLERLRSYESGEVKSVRGILNGTTNYILNEVERGCLLPDAIAHAQAAGFAESNAERDMSGQDAADKLSVIAEWLGWPAVSVESLQCEALSESAIARAKPGSFVLRHVASLTLKRGETFGYVALEPVAPSDPLAQVEGEGNLSTIQLRDGSFDLVRGRGAGGLPTTESVLGDLLALERERRRQCAVNTTSI
ncbi:MAG: homoserine dehydrogenase [Planctomycetota bacterium]|jgi:homoserine dehydrogenase